MGELGQGGIAAHADMGRAAGELGYEAVVVMGEECAETLAMVTAASQQVPLALSVPDPASAATALRMHMQEGDILLFKGSRSAGMERVIAELFPNA